MSKIKTAIEIGKGATKFAGKKIKDMVKTLKARRASKAWKKKNPKKVRAGAAQSRKQTSSLNPYNIRSSNMRSNIPHRAQTQKGSSFDEVKIASQEHAKWASKVGNPGKLKPIATGPTMTQLFRAGVTKGTRRDRILTKKYLRNKLIDNHSKGEFIMTKSTKGYGLARTSGMGLQDEQLKPGKIYKAKSGKAMKVAGGVIKARGGVSVKTKLNGTLFTETS